MSVPLSDVVFAFDFSRIETIGGVRYLWDYGPNGLHFAFPGGAADPTPQLDGSLSFDGGDYLSLPAARLAEFYARMPTREHTYLMLSYHDSTGNSQMPFSCYDNGAGGTNDGLTLQRGSTGTLAAYQWQGDAGTPVLATTAVVLRTGEKAQTCVTVEASPRGFCRQKYEPTTWAAGAFGTAAFNTAIVPRIGMHPNAANPVLGRIYYLALLRGAISSPDLSQLSRMLSEGLKPFCQRGA